MYWENWTDQELAFCEKCGDSFTRKKSETWKRLCLDCYKEKKRRERGGCYPRQDTGEVYRLQRQLQAIREEKEELEDYVWELEHEAQLTRQLKGNLKTLISLCHPDKHGGSEAANEATRLLLSLRG